MDTHTADSSGILDEALERLHRAGPEREGWLSNHAPMTVEALVRHGQAPAVHRWLDGYRDKLEDMPARSVPVTAANWQEALGDPRRLTDWIGHFSRSLDTRPWRDVLTEWWPRLLPGITASATHGVIRVGHAVRTLLDEEPAGDDRHGPRLTELAHALGYWAARHQTLTGIARLPAAAGSAAAGLAAVPRISDQTGGIRDRFARISGLPGRPATDGPDPEHARWRLRELVRAATHRYATHAHGEPVMLVHAATAPNAVLRTLPALPPEFWLPSLDAAWSAATAVTAAYAPAEAIAPAGAAADRTTAGEVFERAAAHGDEHAIKLTDTALDVAAWDAGTDGRGDGLALAAALRAIELIEP
ncbi:MAG: questin oxidase family protein [Streptomyces sp.]|uniref:questin oxidase family protein n=1 Tax=Streptomyces sp. TaxID=1931 RepID=UPI003D6B95A4